MTSRKFHGFLVTNQGIEANPKKIRAILDMKHPLTKKKFNNWAYCCIKPFISRPAERCLPFFMTLWQTKNFQWIDNCRQAFEELKEYLNCPSLLSKPEEGKVLYLYLSSLDEAISSVLIKEEGKGVQKPIYYSNKVLHNAETRYSKAEKLVYALVIATKCLRPYFQAHSVVVLIDQLLRPFYNILIHQEEWQNR